MVASLLATRELPLEKAATPKKAAHPIPATPRPRRAFLEIPEEAVDTTGVD